VADDIVTQLQCIYDKDGCGQCTFCLAKAEIERLRAQVEHAHAILASEGAAWLVVGSSHEQSWRQSLTTAIQSYWDKYGNYFKEADPVDDFIAPIPAESLLPAPPVEPHDHKGHSEEKCIRCGWVMGHFPLNCMNDDTPHVFPSQLSEAATAADEIERLRDQLWAARTGKALLQLEEANAEIERLQAENNALQLQVVAQAIELLGPVHK